MAVKRCFLWTVVAMASSASARNNSYFVRDRDLNPVFSENIVAKILQVAQPALSLEAPLRTYPESVPQTGPNAGKYEYREANFWTCGFLPGSIYALLERAIKFPRSLSVPDQHRPHFVKDGLEIGRHWSVAINQMSGRTDTHDMGFIVQPALQKDWELTGNEESFQSIVRAAHALASRWNPTVNAIRSWNTAVNNRYNITDMSTNFLVIIDSMCNLDLLYWVGHSQNNQTLIEIATTHAHTVRTSNLRFDSSSYHVANFDPRTGDVKAKFTSQGYRDNSTWTRGQAWSIMGFAQTYTWTKDPVLLETAIKCAEYFLKRLEEREGKHHHPFVPAWDFDAPSADPAEPLRDVSAGVIAANGMLIIHQALQGFSRRIDGAFNTTTDFLDAALRIVDETLDMALDRDFASFVPGSSQGDEGPFPVRASGFDAILRHATANNNEDARKRYWDHGLVYADYYLLEFGNKLLRMGLV
ncbi:glycoside hydrolase family 88 protein [Zopfia rhizophila CBS 207.26]|uniref:Glycoside hydrolase family 88 protein n=1 Tax=Zopfia rhizophila CBS 207.26 TaxID=1314779 RepID=A0A6A6DU39_9PEZI|nr:glycoside hydrolase family 88 protein [Zopfia rhizophila CBS 207.26]